MAALRYRYLPDPEHATSVELICRILTKEKRGAKGQWIAREVHSQRKTEEGERTNLSGHIESEDAKLWKVELSCRSSIDGHLLSSWPNKKSIACVLYVDGDRYDEDKFVDWSILPDSECEENPIVIGETPCRFMELPAGSLRKPFMWKKRDQPSDADNSDAPLPKRLEKLSSISLIVGRCEAVEEEPGQVDDVYWAAQAGTVSDLHKSRPFRHKHLTHNVDLAVPKSIPSGLRKGHSEAHYQVEKFTPFVEYTFYYASEASLMARGLHSSVQPSEYESDLPAISPRPELSSTTSQRKRTAPATLSTTTNLSSRRAEKRRRQSTPPDEAGSTPELPEPARPAVRRARRSTTVQTTGSSSSSGRREDARSSTARLDRAASQMSLESEEVARQLLPRTQGTMPTGQAQQSRDSSPEATTSASRPFQSRPGFASRAATNQDTAEPIQGSSTVGVRPSYPTEARPSMAASSSGGLEDQAHVGGARAGPASVVDNDDAHNLPANPNVEQLLKWAYGSRQIPPIVYDNLDKASFEKQMLVKEVRQTLQRCKAATKAAFFQSLSEVMPAMLFDAVEAQLEG